MVGRYCCLSRGLIAFRPGQCMCLRRALAAVSGLDANQQEVDYGTRNSRKLSSTAQGTTRRSLMSGFDMGAKEAQQKDAWWK